MTSAVKSFLILLASLPLLIFIGNEIADEEYAMPFAVMGLVGVALIVALFFRSQRAECLILVFLIAGYMIGCRGFAQLSIVQPIFVGEFGLACILAVMLGRYAVTRELVLPKRWLGALVGIFLGYAFIRLCLDYSQYRLDAVRDSAIVYYSLFFFIAYQVGRRENVIPFLNRALVAIILLQTAVATVLIAKPEWLDLVEIHGVSPLLQKNDLTATFSAMGVIFLALHPELIKARWPRRLLILLMATYVFFLGSRAAAVGMLAVLPLIWISGRRGFMLAPAFIALSGGLFLATVAPLVSERFESMHEEFASVVDFSGSYSYGTDFGEQKRADNRFRLVLWESIYEQTVHDNPLVGKGFGYDFIPTFEKEYSAGHWEGLRSAHNYFITVFGRLGVAGILLLAGIVVCIVRHGVQAALAVRRHEVDDTQALAFWCLTVIVIVSGTFGVVLEGPMGAIPFWSMLGFALASSDRFALAQKAAAEEPASEAPVPQWTQSPLPRPARAG